MLDGSHFGITNDNNLKNSKIDEIVILKVGIIEQRDSFDFKITGKISVLNDQGITILKGVTVAEKWRLKVKNRQNAKYEYSLLLQKYFDLKKAEEQEYKLIERGIGARIKKLGAQFYFKKKLVCDNSEYWLVVDKLSSEQEANNFAEKMFADFNYKIFREKRDEPHALFELFDSESEKLGEAENSIRMVPESPGAITYIYDSTSNDISNNKVSKTAAFFGAVEFRCLDENKVAIICEKTIEKYVENVVALQMSAELPDEIIKAQAIAVRSKAISGLGINHYDDPFDVCSEEHCQVFSSILQIPAKISKAAEDTTGLVLMNKNQVKGINYSAICGGHADSNNFVNSNFFDETFPPVFDGANQDIFREFGDLSQAENLKSWIKNKPDAFCNLSYLKNQNIPGLLKDYFRWHITYDLEELGKIISKNVGTDIGSLYEIIPISRGVSGRLKEIEILASNKNLVIKDQSEICRVLAHDRLLSSCFIIESQMDEQGFPVSFTFQGAGSGHGAGLCQAGGTGMALYGADYSEILKHYFRGFKLKKIYEV
ncbi:hypothetical protein ISS22_14410 [candidate division KSB1 bacterium]|nr:hypothetical protein [candidate division KSB1 bacterium]